MIKINLKGGHHHRRAWAYSERLKKWVSLRKITVYRIMAENIDVQLLQDKQILKAK